MRKAFNRIGWLTLLGMVISWIVIGYSTWYLVTLPLAYISFAISEGKLETMKKWKNVTFRQIFLVAAAFLTSIGIVFGLIQLANYTIRDVLHLSGWIKTISQYAAVILALAPASLLYVAAISRVTKDINKSQEKER